MASTTDVYDVAIIGAGMIGSSAAKYMSEDSYSVKTILIGPSEPQSGIHGAWFDEGRITRKLDKNHVWRNLGRYVIQCSRMSTWILIEIIGTHSCIFCQD